MKLTTTSWLLPMVFLLFLGAGNAQNINIEPTDDLGDVSDAFQENFFEALKQKGIENYELALDALQKAELAANNNPDYVSVVYFEMGKNLKSLDRFDEAEEKLKEVLALKGERLDVMEVMYDLYYQSKNYEAAIPLVEKLSAIDEDYKEDLANLFHRTKQYEKAIEVLDQLDDLWGESVYRNSLRRQIYSITGNSEAAIENLESRIDKNPKNEQDYLNLIYLYSEEGNSEKAFDTAQELLRQNPNSEKVHLALYKFHLENAEMQQAKRSMEFVFKSVQIDKESKYKVLSDFIDYVSEHPSEQENLESMVALFSSEGNGKVYEQLGGFYLSQNEKEKALSFYEKGAALDPDNYSVIKNTLLLQISLEQYEKVISLSELALTTFPAQPMIYLTNGVAQNQTQNFQAAIDSLEAGLDFLFDNPTMEKDFYEQLSKAYSGIGDVNKATEYKRKAESIVLSNIP